jgi:hypothetical protein
MSKQRPLDHVAAIAWINDVLARVRARGGAWTGAERDDLRSALLGDLIADGANEIDVERLARLDRQYARERDASTPRAEVVGELPFERRRRQRAEAARAATVAAEVEAGEPIQGTADAPVDFTSPAAIERHARAERTGRVRPVRQAVAERVARAHTEPRRGFTVAATYSGPRAA